jgi:hypothetical protein
MYFIQHCFICGPLDSTVSEDAGIEPRIVATLVLTARRLARWETGFNSYPAEISIVRKEKKVLAWYGYGTVRCVLDPFLPAGWDDARNCLRDAIPGRDELRPQVIRLSFPALLLVLSTRNFKSMQIFTLSSFFIGSVPHAPMPTH